MAKTTANKSARKSAATDSPSIAMPTGKEMDIPLDKIVADAKFNARKFLPEKQIDKMAHSLKTEGQLAPVRVAARPDGKFDLIYGFRRYHAAKKLNWNTIAATVDQAGNLDETQKSIHNLVENEQRADLTTYERALRYHELTKEPHKLSQSEIARLSNKTPGYVSRLVGAVETCHPKILDRWRKDCEKEVEDPDVFGTAKSLINTTTLKELIKYDHDQQLDWLAREGSPVVDDDEEGDEGDEEGSDKPDTTPRTSLANIKRALTAARAALKEGNDSIKGTNDHSFVEGVIAALSFAVKPKSIKHVIQVKSEDGKIVIVDLSGNRVAAPKK